MENAAPVRSGNLPATLGLILVVLIEIALVLGLGYVALFLVLMADGGDPGLAYGLMAMIGTALLPGLLLIVAFYRLRRSARQGRVLSVLERGLYVVLGVACFLAFGGGILNVSFARPEELVLSLIAAAPPVLLFAALWVTRRAAIAPLGDS